MLLGLYSARNSKLAKRIRKFTTKWELVKYDSATPRKQGTMLKFINLICYYTQKEGEEGMECKHSLQRSRQVKIADC